MIAKSTASTVSMTSTGIMMVSVGPTRVSRIRDTSSLVDQLRPKSKVKTCCTNTQSWYQYGWSTPSCLRMFAICSGLEIFPASTWAGSPPTQLNRKKMSRITPAIVGIICHSLRITYAVMRPLLSPRGSSSHGHLLGGHVQIQELEVGIQNRVLLVPLHPRMLEVVEDAVHAQAPRRIGEQQAVHLPVDPIALGAVGERHRLLVQAVVLGQLELALVRLAGIGAVEQLQEVLRVRIVRDPRRLRGHVVADLLVLEQVGELHRDRVRPQPDLGERLHEELGLLPVLLAAGVVLVPDHEGLAVGLLAPAVAVAVEVAEHVQQRLRLGHVALLGFGAERGVIAHDTRGHRRLRRDGLALADDLDLALAVVREHHRAA